MLCTDCCHLILFLSLPFFLLLFFLLGAASGRVHRLLPVTQQERPHQGFQGPFRMHGAPGRQSLRKKTATVTAKEPGETQGRQKNL